MELKIFNTTNSQLLKYALNSYEKERAAISTNVANVNNPNFKRVDSDFSEMLKAELDDSNLKVSDPRHLTNTKFKSISQVENNGDDEVDITREMSDLVANQIKNEFVSKVLKRYYAGISLAIIGRNR